MPPGNVLPPVSPGRGGWGSDGTRPTTVSLARGVSVETVSGCSLFALGAFLAAFALDLTEVLADEADLALFADLEADLLAPLVALLALGADFLAAGVFAGFGALFFAAFGALFFAALDADFVDLEAFLALFAAGRLTDMEVFLAGLADLPADLVAFLADLAGLAPVLPAAFADLDDFAPLPLTPALPLRGCSLLADFVDLDDPDALRAAI